MYDCRWGTDVVRVIVAGELPQEERNAPLHLFSAPAELLDFASTAYRRHSADTSGLLGQLFEGLRREGFTMSFTMEDFRRQYAKEHFPQLTPEDQREALERLSPEQRRELLQSLPAEERRAVLESLSPEERLAGLSPEQVEQVRQYLDQLPVGGPTQLRKPRRKK